MEPREKAKLILASIIKEAGRSFHGKTRLYKAFYIAHLIHFRKYNGLLSDYPIVRMPRGPAVNDGNKLIYELSEQGVLKLEQQPNGPYAEDIFVLLKEIKGLTSDELLSIRSAVEWIGDKSARELSEWTHEFSNTWEDTRDGQVMNIYADLLTDLEYTEMKQQHKHLGELVDAVFT